MFSFDKSRVSVPADPILIYDEEGRERLTFVGPYEEHQDTKITCKAYGGARFNKNNYDKSHLEYNAYSRSCTNGAAWRTFLSLLKKALDFVLCCLCTVQLYTVQYRKYGWFWRASIIVPLVFLLLFSLLPLTRIRGALF